MALTLAEYVKYVDAPLKRAFILDLLRYSDLIGIIPFVPVEGLQIGGTRWQTLPNAGFRKLNTSYVEGTGIVEDIFETLAILGGDVFVDRVLAGGAGMIQDPLQTQMQMKAKSVAFQYNDTFINGDHAVDADAFEGLKKRVANMPARMTIDLSPGAGDSLKVLASTANEHTFLDSIHQAVKFVDGANYILCNEASWLGLGQVARRLNLFQTITDALGRTWSTISSSGAQVPFLDVGLKGDKSTEIITNTEDPGDGGNDSSSIYICRVDTNDGLHGLEIEGKGMDVYDPTNGGEDPTAPRYIRRIDWPTGLFNLSQYCIARIKGFKMAAA